MTQPAISDEQIIAALLQNKTQRAAAAAVGLSERALYDRMNTGPFRAAYKSAKADLIRAAVSTINDQLHGAVSTIAEIMTDKENNAAVRLQAAQTILNSYAKYSQLLQEGETAAYSQIENNRMFNDN